MKVGKTTKKLVKDVTINDLAVMVKNGFDSVDKRFEQIDGKLGQVDGRLTNLEVKVNEINTRLIDVEKDVSTIKRYLVYREEFEDLMARVKYLESKLNVNSGK